MCTCDRAKGVLDGDHDLKVFACSQKEGAAARTCPATCHTSRSPQCDLAALDRKQPQKIFMVEPLQEPRSLGSLLRTVGLPQSLSQIAPVII